VERALRAAKAVGLLVVEIRIDRRTGELVIVTKREDDSATDATSQNEWDAPPADEMHR
jgi:hypothetical protein